MRVIPTKIHGVLDYLVGLILIAAPWILGFADGGPEQWVPVVIGALNIAGSLLTDYELGLVKLIPMPVHLALDMGAGLVLAVSPWLFGFADNNWWPHLVFGLMEVVVPLMSQTRPSYDSESIDSRSVGIA